MIKCVLKLVRQIKSSYKQTYIKSTDWFQDLALGISRASNTVSENLSSQQLGASNHLLVDLFDSKQSWNKFFDQIKSELRQLNTELKHKWILLNKPSPTTNDDKNNHVTSLHLDATANWMSPALIHQHALRNSTSFILSLISQFTPSSETLEDITKFLIEINGDLNRLPFMFDITMRYKSRTYFFINSIILLSIIKFFVVVVSFFNSSQFQKHLMGSKSEIENTNFKFEIFLYPQ